MEHTFEYKAKALDCHTPWEELPVVITYDSTLEFAAYHATFMSKLYKAEVRFNKQGSSQGHYYAHYDVQVAWLKRQQKAERVHTVWDRDGLKSWNVEGETK